MSNPTTPAAWGIQMSQFWLDAGQDFPINAREVALEVSRRRFKEDPVGLIKPHGVAGVDGMLSKRQKKGDWCISYDEEVELPGRINFTIAHEFGHYLLHRQTTDEFLCGQRQMLDYDSGESKRLEAEANKFASYLLMPADDFRKQICNQAVNVSLIADCAERYGTTFTATALKWVEITDETAMLVVAIDEFVSWSYPSQAGRKQRIYLPPGTPVPQASLDWLKSSGERNTQDKSRRVAPGVWHPGLEAEECAIVSDRYEMTIFLIRFPLATLVDHEEEPESDAVDFLSRRVQGLDWRK